MRCHPCEKTNAPLRRSAPMLIGTGAATRTVPGDVVRSSAGYCDSCGWAITATGALASVSPAAMMLVAKADAAEDRNYGRTHHNGEQAHEDLARRLTEEVKRRSE